MHQHECRYCHNFFVCPEDAHECFARLITCDDCWWKTDFVHIVFVLFLTVVAGALTIFLAAHWRSN